MKKISTFLLLLTLTLMHAQDIKPYRVLLKSAQKSERSAIALVNQSAKAYESTKKPIFAGFLAVGKFFMAKHAFNPLKKMSYFNEGKKTLEKAIQLEPKNLEVRLMRLITQESTPGILGYKQNIAADRLFLEKEYTQTEDLELKAYIKEYLKL